MLKTEALPKRNYILYILFILLSSLLILIDYFSNKELSSYFPNSVIFEFEIDLLKNDDSFFGAYSFSKRLKNGSPHQGHFDTRIGLYEFCKYFI